MPDIYVRPVPLDEKQIERCHQIVDELVLLYRDTDTAHGKNSESGKYEKAKQALNKIGELSGYLTEWAECQVFGTYYKIAKSKEKWIDGDTCNQHDNEIIWYGNNMPDDACTGDNQLMSERAAIAEILKNTFSRYGRMGWRLSMNESLYALNEGQVDWLLTPTNTFQQGNAFDLQNLKWAAVKHVYKLIGDGWKKTAAQQKIAEMCGTSFDAIKKWEREAIKERDKERETLNSIKMAALFIANSGMFKGSQDIYAAALEMYHSCNPQNPDDRHGIWLSCGMIDCVKLDNDYPLSTLKNRLIEAGMRQVA